MTADHQHQLPLSDADLSDEDLAAPRPRLLRRVASFFRSSLVVDAGVLAASQYAGALLGLATTVAAARLLGPSTYGQAVLAMAFPTLVWGFVGTKSMSVTLRYLTGLRAAGRLDEFRATCRVGYGLDAAASLVALVLITVLSRWVSGHVLHDARTWWLPIAYAVWFPFASMSGTSWAILASARQFKRLAVLAIAERAAVFACVVSAIALGFGVAGVVVGAGLGAGVSGLGFAVAAGVSLRAEGIGAWWRAPGSSLRMLRRELWGLFGWNYLSVTLTTVVGQLPPLLLGRACGPEQASYYRIAASIVTTGSYIEASLGRVVYPLLSFRWARGGLQAMRETTRRYVLHVSLPAAALLASGAALLPVVIPSLLGQAYAPMVRGAQFMMVGAVVSVAFFYLSPCYYAAGRIGAWTKGYALYTGLVVAAAWVLSPRWGFDAVAATMGAGTAVFNLAMAEVLRRSWKRSQL